MGSIKRLIGWGNYRGSGKPYRVALNPKVEVGGHILLFFMPCLLVLSYPDSHTCVAKLPCGLQPIEFVAKTIPANYPRTFNHIGGHLKAKRIDEDFFQRDVAKLIGVRIETVLNWEKHKTEPAVQHYPKIITFLGYCPYQVATTFGQKLKRYRMYQGYSLKVFAKQVHADETTVAGWEADAFLPNEKHLQALRLQHMLPDS